MDSRREHAGMTIKKNAGMTIKEKAVFSEWIPARSTRE